MRLVLVTGAGASRRLGHADGLLPLMPDWSDQLCSALDAEINGLAAAALLRPGMSATEFESNLGQVLRFVDSLEAMKSFQRFGHPKATGVDAKVRQWFNVAEAHGDTLRSTLNSVLYELFGSPRIEASGAMAAYRSLLEKLTGVGTPLVCATTNYDPSLEIALDKLGGKPDTGFRRVLGRTPELNPAGLVDWDANHGDRVPVLHLHGAVGWYRKSGTVVEYPADQPYNKTLGTPAVLYPDPEKDPLADVRLYQLWEEFQNALEGATHVFVVGHSLNDGPLVEALRVLDTKKRIGVCVYSGMVKEDVDAESTRIQELLGKQAVPVRIDFGPDLSISDADLALWQGL